jgi:hypothetical protein
MRENHATRPQTLDNNDIDAIAKEITLKLIVGECNNSASIPNLAV